MGKFLDEIRVSPNGRQSAIVQILADLPKPDAADLEEALADPTISAPQISRALNKRGFKISTSVVYRYRENLNGSR